MKCFEKKVVETYVNGDATVLESGSGSSVACTTMFLSYHILYVCSLAIERTLGLVDRAALISKPRTGMQVSHLPIPRSAQAVIDVDPFQLT